MSVSLDEHRLGGLRWIVLRGPDREAYWALGEHMRAELAAIAGTWPLLARLHEHVSRSPGRDQLARVRRASAGSFPAVWAELSAFAAGAGLPLEELALLNVRGDLGQVAGGVGCSDLAWRRERSVIAHNEDGVPANAGQCALLTLILDGLPAVTAFWYPGFLPSNAFTVTGDGLVWSIDHLPVAEPGGGAGRHVVARGLQRSARTLDDAVRYLREHPCAGGFAYTIGDPAGRIVSVETVAGGFALAEAEPGSAPLLWHTNHGRYLPGAGPPDDRTSAARGRLLEALPIPAAEPGPEWFLRILAWTPLPDGVRGDPGPGQLTTLCTLVADLTAGHAVIAVRDGDPVAIPLADLARGVPERSRRVQF